MGKIMSRLRNCLNSFFCLVGMLAMCVLVVSCEKRRKGVERKGVDYRFNEKSEGWYFLLYEQADEKKLEVLNGRVQLEYPKGTRLVKTSSKPDFGWAKDHYFLNSKEVKSSDLGGMHPGYYSEVNDRGKVTKYEKFYLGDFKNIDRYGDPDKILEKLLAEQKQKKSK